MVWSFDPERHHSKGAAPPSVMGVLASTLRRSSSISSSIGFALAASSSSSSWVEKATGAESFRTIASSRLACPMVDS